LIMVALLRARKIQPAAMGVEKRHGSACAAIIQGISPRRVGLI
jgi:hypothetical protein